VSAWPARRSTIAQARRAPGLGEDVVGVVGCLQRPVGGGPGEPVVTELDHQLRGQRVQVGEHPVRGGGVALGAGGHRGGQQTGEPGGDVGVAAELEHRLRGGDLLPQPRQGDRAAAGGERVEQGVLQHGHRVRPGEGRRGGAEHRGAGQAGQSGQQRASTHGFGPFARHQDDADPNGGSPRPHRPSRGVGQPEQVRRDPQRLDQDAQHPHVPERLLAALHPRQRRDGVAAASGEFGEGQVIGAADTAHDRPEITGLDGGADLVGVPDRTRWFHRLRSPHQTQDLRA
jgi:hypothetical protein